MKLINTALALALLSYGTLAVAQTAKPTTMPAQPMDHSKMHMDHGDSKAEFAKLDKNKDGKLSKAEIPSDNPLTHHFDMLDANKDGSLSAAEFAKHHNM